ncbi:hypothetical protein BKA70DRAFT_1561622 [Coprinopsis sp. MPI-PUGE-AT-0042]|nr:hypothetical protein BKA70DRAFT_1561622 [Coprinopsis sp. MPI-PUGE-AT-0042]
MASNIVSLPSLSSHLSSLPQATSFSNIDLHRNMYAARAVESEAKLQKALSKQAASQPQAQPQQTIPGYAYPAPQAQHDPSQPIMMRKKKFST